MGTEILKNHPQPRAKFRPAPSARASNPQLPDRRRTCFDTVLLGPILRYARIPRKSLIFAANRHFLRFLFFFSPISPTFAALIFKIMLAVVKIAGQQFKVQKDQTLYVPRIAGNAGDKVEFAEVLLAHGDDNLSVGKDVKAVIKAEIIGHVQGDKVIAFKMKRRKGFRKKHG